MSVPSCISCGKEYGIGANAPMLLHGCGHAICNGCIEGMRGMGPEFHRCPTCRSPVDLALSHPNLALQEALGLPAIQVNVAADMGLNGHGRTGDAGAGGSNHICSVHGKELLLWCCEHNFLGCGACFREPPHEDCDRFMLDQARANLERDLAKLLDDMRDCGKRLKAVQERVDAKANTLPAKRDALIYEITQYFDDYIAEVKKRRDSLMEQAQVYWEGLETSTAFEKDYVQQGLRYLQERYNEVKGLREKDVFTYLQNCPQLIDGLSSAVTEARNTLPKVESDFGRSNDPAFSAPSPASNRHALLAVKVLANVPQPQPPHSPQQQGFPDVVADGQQRYQQQQAAIHGGDAKPSPLDVDGAYGHGVPSPMVDTKQTASPSIAPAAGKGGPTGAWAKAAAAKPVGGVGVANPLVAGVKPPQPPPRPQAGVPSPVQPQNGGVKPASGVGGGGRVGLDKKRLDWLSKRYPGVPICEEEEPYECEAIIDNVANEGRDGFFHFLSPDGTCMAVYYNLTGKVGTDNPDNVDPKTIKKGQRYLVELKDNPYAHLIVHKPERRWVAASIRKISKGHHKGSA